MAQTGFSVGFGEVDITPPNPVLLVGYYYERRSTGVHDPLGVRAMAVSDGSDHVVLCVADLVYLNDEVVNAARRLVKDQCGLDADHLILCCMHTHTGPLLTEEREYASALPAKLAEAVCWALDDLAPVGLQVARGEEHMVSFVRRYRMKYGSVRTNPGILNPDVSEPLGMADSTVSALLASDGAPKGGLVHFALHNDTVGGTEISADWTHYVRECVHEKLGKDLCLLTPIGAAGDVNHWNVFREVTYRGFEETERIGTAIGRAALKALEEAEPVLPGPVRGMQKTVEVDLRYPTDEELAEAKRIWAKHPQDGVDFTMDRVEARRRIRVAELGRTAGLEITVLAFGNVALVGMPCELFTDLGRAIKLRSPFEHTLIVTLADASIGYVGPRDAFDEGGYEMASTLLAPGMAEKMTHAALELLTQAETHRQI